LDRVDAVEVLEVELGFSAEVVLLVNPLLVHVDVVVTSWLDVVVVAICGDADVVCVVVGGAPVEVVEAVVVVIVVMVVVVVVAG
jgi:hypothetical protein